PRDAGRAASRPRPARPYSDRLGWLRRGGRLPLWRVSLAAGRSGWDRVPSPDGRRPTPGTNGAEPAGTQPGPCSRRAVRQGQSGTFVPDTAPRSAPQTRQPKPRRSLPAPESGHRSRRHLGFALISRRSVRMSAQDTFLILHGWGGNKPEHWQEHLVI